MQQEMTREWVVMKFGGTSVSSAECWNTICRQVKHNVLDGKRVLIVVSAISGVTNLLSRLVEQEATKDTDSLKAELRTRHTRLLEALGMPGSRRFEIHRDKLAALLEKRPATLDAHQKALIIAHGELLSSSIGKQVLAAAGIDAHWQDARKLLSADPGLAGDVLAATCDDHPDPEMEGQLSSQGDVHITQGFIASGPAETTCLLGRGGSDTSAAILAARLQAVRLEIWTDVPGIFSADPRIVPEARLLRRLSYSEAQELASMGARVLHPPSIQPARRHNVPVHVRDTNRPDEAGTRIGRRSASEEAQVKGVVSRERVTLISMETPSMWRQAGFLADAFAVFKRHGYSVDLISTSESTVTVSLDPLVPAHFDADRMSGFLDDLRQLCRVSVHNGCISISLVGNSIRTILGRLSAALDVFQDRHVHMVTQSANDLNLTLVVDPEHALSLVRKLHQLLIASAADNRPEFGPSWQELTRIQQKPECSNPWWVTKAPQLEALMADREMAYVYDLDTARQAARRVKCLDAVSRIFYAVKANDHAGLLCVLAEEGVSFECVSMAEVHHVLSKVPGAGPGDILFTPNFAPREEYQEALQQGIRLTVDNSWIIQQWPELFAGQDIFLRLDLDTGYGHHKKVITSGADSKFGISLEHIDRTIQLLNENGAKVVGLHAHTGSGVHNAEVWSEQLQRFLNILPLFPDTKILDLGGGLGVPDRRGQAGFDLARMNDLLAETIGDRDIEIWLEPGRYLAAECGVLLSRVTQLKKKGRYHYLGINAGMNALIRPALYGAYHDIEDLSRLGDPAERLYRVVGPICESGDVVRESRFLPVGTEGDIMLVANTGAYGRVMTSRYNRRFPPEELTL
jgi:diaminopimelate decarboxylase/aspartate kinase